MLLRTAARLFSLIRQTILPRPFPGLRRYLYRLLVLVIFLPLLLLLQLVHWIGFLVDEIFFSAYRKVDVAEPVFVLGAPRSGTTFMHRLLANDSGFTTFSTWECLFAPSITERYLWLGLARVDRAIGRPLHRIVGWLEKKSLAWIEDVHPMSLTAPEEDYFALLPILACFVLVVPFPESEWLWQMGRFDRDVDERERAAVMKWYRRCLQKHLYVRGCDRALLSKNASFAGMAQSLVETFPDCHLVICERDSVQVVASQFNALAGGMQLFGIPQDDSRFRRNLLDCLAFYYENLARAESRVHERRCIRVPLWELSRNTRETITGIFDRFERPLSPDVDSAIVNYERRTVTTKAPLKPELSSWGIDAAKVTKRFAKWRHEEAIRL